MLVVDREVQRALYSWGLSPLGRVSCVGDDAEMGRVQRAAGGGETIPLVLVDGDALVRGFMVDRLSGVADFQVVGVADGVRDAVEVARSCRADVVVAEARLPDGAGDDVCARLRSDGVRDCGCVVSSSLPRRPGRSVPAGVDAFVLKELVGDTLESEIRRVGAASRAAVSNQAGQTQSAWNLPGSFR